MKAKSKKTGNPHRRIRLSHRLAAAMTTGMFFGLHGEAFAGAAPSDAVQLSNNLVNSGASLTKLISLTGYICGSSLVVLGIMRLKQHVDSPAQIPMREGVMRLCCAGGLLSLPFIIGVMQGSISGGAANGVGVPQAKLAAFGGTGFGTAALPQCTDIIVGGVSLCDSYFGVGNWQP